MAKTPSTKGSSTQIQGLEHAGDFFFGPGARVEVMPLHVATSLGLCGPVGAWGACTGLTQAPAQVMSGKGVIHDLSRSSAWGVAQG